MIGKKKLQDVHRDLAKIMAKLPAESPGQWLDREMQAATDQPGRDLETLEMLKAELNRAVKKRRLQVKTRTTR